MKLEGRYLEKCSFKAVLNYIEKQNIFEKESYHIPLGVGRCLKTVIEMKHFSDKSEAFTFQYLALLYTESNTIFFVETLYKAENINSSTISKSL